MEQAGGGRGRAEAAAGTRGMPASLIVRTIAARAVKQPRCQIVARHDGDDDVAAAYRAALRQRPYRGHHHGAGMAATAEVVQFQRMCRRAVDQGCRRRRGLVPASPQRDVAAAAGRRGAGRDGFDGVRAAARDAGSHRIQEKELGRARDLQRAGPHTWPGPSIRPGGRLACPPNP